MSVESVLVDPYFSEKIKVIRRELLLTPLHFSFLEARSFLPSLKHTEFLNVLTLHLMLHFSFPIYSKFPQKYMCLLFPFCLLPFSLDPTPVGLLRLLCLCPSSKAIPVIVIDDIQIAKLISQVSVFIQFDPSATLDTASHSLFLKTLCSVSFHKTTQPWVCFLLPY